MRVAFLYDYVRIIIRVGGGGGGDTHKVKGCAAGGGERFLLLGARLRNGTVRYIKSYWVFARFISHARAYVHEYYMRARRLEV